MRARKTGSAKPCGARRAEGAALGAGSAKAPFALTESGAHGLVVAAANAPARALGVTAGLGFADAKARAPELLAQEIDRAADARALAKLALWMVRYAPLVALDGTDGLMLETTGCAHLYGGEATMAARIEKTLRAEGLAARLGLAETPGAASALARGMAGSGPHILAPGEARAGLAQLPVAALRLSEDAETLLRRFGLTRIGQLYDVDRAALARRFRSRAHADAVLLRLDQALGRRAEPIIPVRAPPAYIARLSCPEPLISLEGLEAGLARLADQLCAELARAGQGARSFVLRVYRSNATSACVAARAARPARARVHIRRLFRDKLERVDLGLGADEVTLEARRTGPMAESAIALSGDLAASDIDEAALAALADRITAKLGDAAVVTTTPAESHIPERAERAAVYEGAIADWSGVPPPAGPRPLRMLARPERVDVLAEIPDGPPRRFVWRRVVRDVARADGPERIAPEWWRLEENDARARDYYRVEDARGRRYWLYREGLYDDGDARPPRWFVHGLFP